MLLEIAYLAANRLLFIFTLIDPAAPKREFSFVVDVAQQYKVPQCDPPLAAMPALVQQLNEDRDLHGFLKQGEAAVSHKLTDSTQEFR